jgi:hypothetical protein
LILVDEKRVAQKMSFVRPDPVPAAGKIPQPRLKKGLASGVSLFQDNRDQKICPKIFPQMQNP